MEKSHLMHALVLAMPFHHQLSERRLKESKNIFKEKSESERARLKNPARHKMFFLEQLTDFNLCVRLSCFMWAQHKQKKILKYFHFIFVWRCQRSKLSEFTIFWMQKIVILKKKLKVEMIFSNCYFFLCIVLFIDPKVYATFFYGKYLSMTIFFFNFTLLTQKFPQTI